MEIVGHAIEIVFINGDFRGMLRTARVKGEDSHMRQANIEKKYRFT